VNREPPSTLQYIINEERLKDIFSLSPYLCHISAEELICQWSYDLFMLQSHSGLATQRNVSNCNATMVVSEATLGGLVVACLPLDPRFAGSNRT
jgi:hypothetical protein